MKPTGLRFALRYLIRVILFVCVLLSVHTSANAQFHTEKGVVVGMKVGASSYNGDVDFVRPGQNQFDMTLEGELFYRFGRWFSLGVKQSVGKYPELASTATRRTSTALAVRSYLIPSRFSPYIQVGASRSSGGTEAGFGFALATGFELEVSRYLSIYQDISFDQVLPDAALDGVTGGRNYDMFGRLGGGIRVRFGRGERGFRLAGIDQPDSLLVNEDGQFHARFAGADDEEVSVKWDLPGGVVSTDNPLVYAWPNPGRYEVHLTVDLGDEQQSDVMFVKVYRPFVEDTVAIAQRLAKAVHMENVTGTLDLTVGEEGSYGMQIQKGAVWPIQYDWDMGDGSVLVGAYIVHQYEQPGTYNVVARASNEFGQDSRALTVEVKPAPEKEAVTPARPVDPTTTGDRAVAEVPNAARESPTVESGNTAQKQDPDPETAKPAVEEQTVDQTPVAEPAMETEPAEKLTTVESDAIDSNATPQEAVTPENPPLPPANQIQFDAGGYSWAVEEANSASEAAKLAERYKFVGFPYGYKKDRSTGKYNVLVGQFASEQVAQRLSRRIQPHAPRRIWLVKL